MICLASLVCVCSAAVTEIACICWMQSVRVGCNSECMQEKLRVVAA